MNVQSKMVFLGGDHRGYELPRTLMNSYVCHATEIYNYILAMKNKSNNSLLICVRCKLLYINTLISYGYLDKAYKYIYILILDISMMLMLVYNHLNALQVLNKHSK